MDLIILLSYNALNLNVLLYKNKRKKYKERKGEEREGKGRGGERILEIGQSQVSLNKQLNNIIETQLSSIFPLIHL